MRKLMMFSRGERYFEGNYGPVSHSRHTNECIHLHPRIAVSMPSPVCPGQRATVHSSEATVGQRAAVAVNDGGGLQGTGVLGAGPLLFIDECGALQGL